MLDNSLKNVISVATVVLNDVDNIEATIKSVLSQDGCDIEYIVIDGGSTDGTLAVIEKYRHKIHYCCSEKDQGIYFAMNKAIDVAAGQWMIFMNSGDCFFSPTVVRDVFAQVSANADVIYGQHVVKYGSHATRQIMPGNIKDLWKGMFLSHQAMFVRTFLLKAEHFDCDFRLAADFELVSKLFQSGSHFLYIPEVVAVVSVAGVSDTMRAAVFKEYSCIAARYFADKPYRSYFRLKRVDAFLRSLAKKILPCKLIRWIQTTA